MDQGRMAELLLQLKHRHSDGSWGTLERRPPHDPAELDPEIGWADGTLYACRVCDEQVVVRSPVGDGPVDRP
jgi:hypothetical protein